MSKAGFDAPASLAFRLTPDTIELGLDAVLPAAFELSGTIAEFGRAERIGADTIPRGSVQGAAELVGIRPSTVKRHLADLRARSGLSTGQLIYAGRASGRLVAPSLEPT